MKTENKAAIIFSIIIIVGVISIYFFYNELDLKRNTTNSMIVESKNNPSEAPNLSGATGYINTSQNQLETLIENNVVLYDIWTYSCINCIRTLPYITSWDDKYSDMGLVIIGIHTPEFEFEKQKQNVLMAVKKFGIEYPVVMDNEKESYIVQRRSIHSINKIKKGQKITRENLIMLRPELPGSFKPNKVEEIIGKTVLRDIPANSSILQEYINS